VLRFRAQLVQRDAVDLLRHWLDQAAEANLVDAVRRRLHGTAGAFRTTGDITAAGIDLPASIASGCLLRPLPDWAQEIAHWDGRPASARGRRDPAARWFPSDRFPVRLKALETCCRLRRASPEAPVALGTLLEPSEGVFKQGQAPLLQNTGFLLLSIVGPRKRPVAQHLPKDLELLCSLQPALADTGRSGTPASYDAESTRPASAPFPADTGLLGTPASYDAESTSCVNHLLDTGRPWQGFKPSWVFLGVNANNSERQKLHSWVHQHPERFDTPTPIERQLSPDPLDLEIGISFSRVTKG
jgi:hypothetical protein